MALILIVDDDPDMVESSKVVLESRGYETVSAGSREDGLATAQEANPDLILLDVMMEQPDDGIALAQDLRRKGISTPIVMLTGINALTGFQYGDDREALPVQAFLEKPVSPEMLLNQVANLLD